MSKDVYKSKTLQLLRARMFASKKNQTQIAEATGVGQSVIGRIFRDDVQSPTVTTYDKISDYMDALKVPKRPKNAIPKTIGSQQNSESTEDGGALTD